MCFRGKERERVSTVDIFQGVDDWTEKPFEKWNFSFSLLGICLMLMDCFVNVGFCFGLGSKRYDGLERVLIGYVYIYVTRRQNVEKEFRGFERPGRVGM